MHTLCVFWAVNKYFKLKTSKWSCITSKFNAKPYFLKNTIHIEATNDNENIICNVQGSRTKKTQSIGYTPWHCVGEKDIIYLVFHLRQYPLNSK